MPYTIREPGADAAPATGYTIRDPEPDSSNFGGNIQKLLSLLPGINGQNIDVQKLLTMFPSLAPATLSANVPDAALGARNALHATGQVMSGIGESVSSPELAAKIRAEQNRLDAEAAQIKSTQKSITPQGPASHVFEALGSAATTAPVFAGLSSLGAQALAQAPALMQLMKQYPTFAAMMQGGAGGALGSVFEPVEDSSKNFAAQKGKQAVKDAAIGGGLGGAFATAAKAVDPTVDAFRRLLYDEKIGMTPGQASGIPMVKAFEEKLASWPFLGDTIIARWRNGISDFNKALYQRALAPFESLAQTAAQPGANAVVTSTLGPQIAAEARMVMSNIPVGREGVKKVGDFASSVYDRALAASGPMDSSLVANLNQDLANLASVLPASRQQDFLTAMRREIGAHITPAGTLTPSAVKGAQENIGKLANRYSAGLNSGDDRVYADALQEATRMLRANMAQANPQVAPIIRAADEAWATVAQIEQAAQYANSKAGVITPAQFMQGLRTNAAGYQPRVRNRGVSRGEQLNIDLADAAKDVLPATYPDSGSIGRLMQNFGIERGIAALAGAGGAAAATHTIPATLAFTGLASLPYMPGVSQGIGRMLTAPRSQGLVDLADLLRQAPAPTAFVTGQAQ